MRISFHLSSIDEFTRSFPKEILILGIEKPLNGRYVGCTVPMKDKATMGGRSYGYYNDGIFLFSVFLCMFIYC